MEKLFSNKLAKNPANSATQQFLDIAEIKEDTVVLKNGALRALLAVSAINYDLKSTEEQEAIIIQYQNFLNSLDFPLQILITSRKINMGDYLDFLEKKEKTQDNELLKLQISEYRNFISQLISISNIMDKNFYLVIPFAPIESMEKSFIGNLMSMFNPKKNILEKRETFETYRNQLFQRAEHVTAGLSGIGLRMTPLKTQELIELMYNSYNPAVYTPDEISNVENLDLKNSSV
jgi:hypothetical protein